MKLFEQPDFRNFQHTLNSVKMCFTFFKRSLHSVNLYWH